MKQIAHKLYIGAEVATETLKQRFHGVLQKRWNPITRKNEYHTVAEYHNEYLSLLTEVRDMDPATASNEVPELAQVFFHGLIPRLKERRELAALTNFPAPSAHLGENMSRLQAIAEAAKIAEAEVNQIVSISMGNNFRRNPVGGNATQQGRTFLGATLTNSSGSSEIQTPPRTHVASGFGTPGSRSTTVS